SWSRIRAFMVLVGRLRRRLPGLELEPRGDALRPGQRAAHLGIGGDREHEAVHPIQRLDAAACDDVGARRWPADEGRGGRGEPARAPAHARANIPSTSPYDRPCSRAPYVPRLSSSRAACRVAASAASVMAAPTLTRATPSRPRSGTPGAPGSHMMFNGPSIARASAAMVSASITPGTKTPSAPAARYRLARWIVASRRDSGSQARAR